MLCVLTLFRVSTDTTVYHDKKPRFSDECRWGNKCVVRPCGFVRPSQKEEHGVTYCAGLKAYKKSDVVDAEAPKAGGSVYGRR